MEIPPAVILVADDTRNSQMLIEFYLKDSPLETVMADDGRQALDAFRERTFDLVIMDVHMPVMDGLAATRAIRALERESNRTPTPIMALTANDEEGDEERCREAGCTAFLTKPFSKKTLLEAIRTALA